MLAALYLNADVSFTYLGLETVGSFRLHHIRIENTFTNSDKLRVLARYSRKDLWIDESTGLPSRLKYERREGRGALGSTEVEVLYGDYRSVNGFLFPFKVIQLLNGTPWGTTTVESVAINSGVADAEFAVN
jgi:hypothetical protein